MPTRQPSLQLEEVPLAKITARPGREYRCRVADEKRRSGTARGA